MKTRLTAEMARDLFTISESDGVLRHKHDTGRWGRIKAGTPCGTPHGRGYVAINVMGHRYLAHRVVWLMVHGDWPTMEVDHIDGDKLNNRPSNLRDVSHSLNQQNRRSAQRNSKSGRLGVMRQGKSFHATLRHAGRSYFIGAFSTLEEASAAHIEAKRRIHQGCTL